MFLVFQLLLASCFVFKVDIRSQLELWRKSSVEVETVDSMIKLVVEVIMEAVEEA